MEEEKNKEIYLNGVSVPYILKTSSRAKNLRIMIRPGGIVAAVKPRGISDRAVEDFLARKANWVVGTIDRLKNRNSLLAAGTKADFKRCSRAARVLALEKLEAYNKIYQVKFNRVAIRDQATRWGSCSRKGNLNFNYRIVLLPGHLSDYIVAHEMCHLREFNHSKKFWDLVARAIPDYAAKRQELRRNFS